MVHNEQPQENYVVGKCNKKQNKIKFTTRTAFRHMFWVTKKSKPNSAKIDFCNQDWSKKMSVCASDWLTTFGEFEFKLIV